MGIMVFITYADIVVCQRTIFDGTNANVSRVLGNIAMHTLEKRDIEKDAMNSIFAHD